jgi:ADP-heptose:LPS heptosyltransferase
LVKHLGHDVELHSVQTQGAEQAEQLGVTTHEFEDFADCAQTMLAMDEIISVDTAALHLAGAIGHPRVTGLLSYWSSWRWVARWYDNVTLLRQSVDGDWTSALAQR